MHYFVAIVFVLLGTPQASQPRVDQRSAVTVVVRIQRADYEGDRAALVHLYEELAPFTEDKAIASKIHYWRGFALWRRAVNGFNDNVDPQELENDLKHAWSEFDTAAQKDSSFADAKVGALGCASLIGYLNRHDSARLQELITQAQKLKKDAEALAPDNPRLLWVMGPNTWNAPPERGGGQAKAIAMYKKGLEEIQKRKTARSDVLEPSWGEPELLMNLAYSYLHQTSPDVNAAEESADQALKLVPYWHYLRDILLPQIREAKAKAAAKSPNTVK